MQKINENYIKKVWMWKRHGLNKNNSEGGIGAFENNTLRITDSNCDFHDMNQEVSRRFEFNDEIKEAIARKE